MRTVVGDGIVLEPQVAAHAPEMFAVLSDPAIYEFENQPPASAALLEQRFRLLESRESPGGGDTWLNWIVRLPGGEAIGYVQATLDDQGSAGIAYVFASRYWGRGLARRSVETMIGELRSHHGARRMSAVLKAANLRSLRLLQRLGFTAAAQQAGIDADEIRMQRDLQGS